MQKRCEPMTGMRALRYAGIAQTADQDLGRVLAPRWTSARDRRYRRRVVNTLRIEVSRALPPGLHWKLDVAGAECLLDDRFPGLRSPGFVRRGASARRSVEPASFPGFRGPSFVGSLLLLTRMSQQGVGFPGFAARASLEDVRVSRVKKDALRVSRASRPGFRWNVARGDPAIRTRVVSRASRPGLRWKTGNSLPGDTPGPVSRASRPALRWKGAPRGMVRRMRVVSRASRPGLRWKTMKQVRERLLNKHGFPGFAARASLEGRVGLRGAQLVVWFPGLRGPGFVGRRGRFARRERCASSFPGFAARASLEPADSRRTRFQPAQGFPGLAARASLNGMRCDHPDPRPCTGLHRPGFVELVAVNERPGRRIRGFTAPVSLTHLRRFTAADA